MRNWHITTISYRARDGKKKTLYRVDGEIDGKRYRKAFGDRKLANEHMAQKVADGAEQDELPRQALLTSLTQAKLTTVEQALARLRNAGCDRDTDILEAVTQYIERRTEQAALTSKRLGDAILEFVIDKKNNGRSEATLDGLNSRLRRFASEMFGVEFGRDNEGNETVAKGTTIMVSHANTKTIQDWLARFTELVTKKTERAVLSNFFNRCVQSGYIKESPVARTDKIKPPAPLPEILSLECVTKMLAFARDYKHGLTLPYFVLGCFCALRPSEIRRLTWDDIDIVNKQIDIHSDKTKTRARRTVDIPENAASWLELCQITGKTELAPPRRALDALKRAGGYQGRVFRSKSKSQEKTAKAEQTTELPDWPEDALRHTAITYHYELHEHEGKTAKWAGNSPDVIHRHYKGRIGGDRKAAVAAFWGLRNPTFKYAWLASDEAQTPEE